MTLQSKCKIEQVESQPKELQNLDKTLRKFLPYLHKIRDVAAAMELSETSRLTFDYSYVSNRGTLYYTLWGFQVKIEFVVKVDGPTITHIEVVYPSREYGLSVIIGKNYSETRKIGRREFTFQWNENGDLTMINVGREESSLTYSLINGSWWADGPHYKTAPKNLARCTNFMGVVIPWRIDYRDKVKKIIGDTNLYHLFVCFREIWPCEFCFSNFATHPESQISCSATHPESQKLGHAYKAKL